VRNKLHQSKKRGQGRRRNSGLPRIAPNGKKEQNPRIPGIVSLPTRLTRRSSRPAWTFGVFIMAPSARAAERGRWAACWAKKINKEKRYDCYKIFKQ